MLDNYCLVHLSHNRFSIVDGEDIHKLLDYSFYLSTNGSNEYGVTRIKREYITIHQLIMGCKSIDHINGIGLDNRKCNLRKFQTSSQNNANSRTRKDNTSGAKGVSWHKRDKKWQANIQVQGRPIGLGYFDNIEDAINAYDDASVKYFGEFSRNNKTIDPDLDEIIRLTGFGKPILKSAPFGENHVNAKLTYADIPRVQDMYFKENMSQLKIANILGVNQTIISRILSGKAWKK